MFVQDSIPQNLFNVLGPQEQPARVPPRCPTRRGELACRVLRRQRPQLIAFDGALPRQGIVGFRARVPSDLALTH